MSRRQSSRQSNANLDNMSNLKRFHRQAGWKPSSLMMSQMGSSPRMPSNMPCPGFICIAKPSIWQQAHRPRAGFLTPYVLSKTNNEIKAIAREDIPEGLLVIPVFCMRDSSYMSEGSVASRSQHEVVGRVKWKTKVKASE